MKKILGFAVILGLVSFDLYANARYSIQKAKNIIAASRISSQQTTREK